MKQSLPIDTILPELQRSLALHAAVVLEAPPGAGKTTRVPLALLDEPWLAGNSILMLEPRRLAARGAAGFMAEELGEACGQTVGYRVRFDNQVSRNTRIEVVTEGILTRRLQQDPELDGVGLVIFDEFHERNLHSDLALSLCRDAQQGLREDLKLLVMSATLDGDRIAALLDAPVIRSHGRSYPVDIRYLPRDPEGRLPETVAGAVERALKADPGDCLVFLPGAGEIRRTETLLSERLSNVDIEILPLFGDLPFDAQQRAILPSASGHRKVVLATAIAETSLTIEGVGVVIDSGWQRVPRFDPRSGLTQLETVRVSRASAEQRAGRAGRLGPGVCYRLWGEGTQRGLIPYNAPEILEADLMPIALELAQWGIDDVQMLTWLDPPPVGAFAQARELLQQLQALDEHLRITQVGREMVALPMHPRLSHMLIKARSMELGAVACDVAALISERDPLRNLEGERRCDFALRLEALHAHRTEGNRGARHFGADAAACAAVERASRQSRRLLKVQANDAPVDESQVGLLLALAYPDRIAQRRSPGAGRYLLSNGRGARLLNECAISSELIVAASLDGRGDESRVFLAASVKQPELEKVMGERITWQSMVSWDRNNEAVVARDEQRLGALVLAHRPLAKPDPEKIAQVMLDGIRDMGLESLPWSDEARQLQARLCSLAHWQPQAGWPDTSDQALLSSIEEWLSPYLGGMSRRDHLTRLNMYDILKNRLAWDKQQQLEQAAPTHLQVPSGSRKKLSYSTDGSPPVLAVKLQELFGLADTPTVAAGKVAVMLHLLSPAQRPLQVTQDLKSFWNNTYPEVKKEMKGRYPKHPWPDDPWNAPPTARAKKRN